MASSGFWQDCLWEGSGPVGQAEAVYSGRFYGSGPGIRYVGATGVLTELKAAIPELFGVAMCFLKGPLGIWRDKHKEVYIYGGS